MLLDSCSVKTPSTPAECIEEKGKEEEMYLHRKMSFGNCTRKKSEIQEKNKKTRMYRLLFVWSRGELNREASKL